MHTHVGLHTSCTFVKDIILLYENWVFWLLVASGLFSYYGNISVITNTPQLLIPSHAWWISHLLACHCFVCLQILKHLSDWIPLENAQFAVDVFEQWKDILNDLSQSGASSQRWVDLKISVIEPPVLIKFCNRINMYEKMVWTVWVPKMRSAVR
jgi:hypothetical protein